ncbi:hypothetical protein Efla_005686 [Eimeria flavescens]
MGAHPSLLPRLEGPFQNGRVAEAVHAGGFPCLISSGRLDSFSLDRAFLLQLLQSFEVQRRADKLRLAVERKQKKHADTPTAASGAAAAAGGASNSSSSSSSSRQQGEKEDSALRKKEGGGFVLLKEIASHKCPSCVERLCQAHVMGKDALYFSREAESLIFELRRILDASDRHSGTKRLAAAAAERTNKC